MSRVHDALRRAEEAQTAVSAPEAQAQAPALAPVPASVGAPPSARAGGLYSAAAVAPSSLGIGPDLLRRVVEVPFAPARDAHIIDITRPHDAPAEEFRTLRTRVNHLQTQQALRTLVITSPSPAEGKSFAAVNLAIAESQLDGNNTLLIDCDFRRPIAHSLFQFDRSPGMTEFLQGKAELHECMRRIQGTNLYVIPAGEAVVNPLELLNRIEMKQLIDLLPRVFNWVLLDSPPLLFAADASLLSTISSGTILVVRIGATTIDSVTRAMQSLCENNVLGIIVNGARRGELYSKYTYYHSYYYAEPEPEPAPEMAAEKEET
jgi:receptor protein-tyrosine kinase